MYLLMRRSIRNINIPSGNAPGIWTFEDWLVQIPAPMVQNCIQIPHPSTGFDCQMPLLKINCFHWSTNVAKIFSKAVDSFSVEQVLGLNKSLASVIPRGENLLFLTRFIATDKCFPFNQWPFKLWIKFDTSGSNFPPHPSKVKFPTPGMVF